MPGLSRYFNKKFFVLVNYYSEDGSLTPMDVDEALARMDALGHKFFIYLDSESGKVNVLYERDDGSYGDIEVE